MLVLSAPAVRFKPLLGALLMTGAEPLGSVAQEDPATMTLPPDGRGRSPNL